MNNSRAGTRHSSGQVMQSWGLASTGLTDFFIAGRPPRGDAAFSPGETLSPPGALVLASPVSSRRCLCSVGHGVPTI